MMLYVGTITPAQSWKELRQSVTVHMDSFYDKAAEAKSREEWDNYVNTGFANIINAWEIQALTIIDKEDDEYQNEKEKLLLELENEKENQYQKWAKNKINITIESNYAILKAKLDKEEDNYELKGINIEEDKKKLAEWDTYAQQIIDEYLNKIENKEVNELNLGEEYYETLKNAFKQEVLKLAESNKTRLVVKYYGELKRNTIKDAEESANVIMQDILAKTTDKIKVETDELWDGFMAYLGIESYEDLDPNKYGPIIEKLGDTSMRAVEDDYVVTYENSTDSRTSYVNYNSGYNEEPYSIVAYSQLGYHHARKLALDEYYKWKSQQEEN